MEPVEYDLYLNPISIGLVLLAILTLCLYKRQNRAKLPPGPWHIPFIGNAWELAADPDLRKSLRRLHKQYGDIYRLYMGPKLAVVISGYETIKEVFVKRGGEFSDRPDSLYFSLIAENQGIASPSGELWKEHRKFALITLKNFGFGKTSLEGKIHTEVSILLSDIAKQKEKPFRSQHLVQASVSNVISAMTFGGHFKHDDPRFTRLMTILDEYFEDNGPNNVVAFFPFLRYLPGDLFHVKKTLRNIKYIEGFIGELIDKHIENFDENKMEDFIDAFLLEMLNNRDKKDSTFTKKQLTKTVLDLFSAGTETTATAITWVLLYLAAKDDIQARVFREINEIVGTDRLPSLQDKRNLVYTEAFIMEILRACNIATLSIPHTCAVDTKLRGFDIPKGTTLLPDIDSVLFDPKIWGDPEEFRPERFIGEEGTLLNPDEFIPFFTGRRNCVGESLARMELYLFISALVQRKTQMYMKAHFSYDPMKDRLIPCKEAGLPFQDGDVLQILSGDDSNWWQAKIATDELNRVGLIPSQKLEENRKAFVRADMDYSTSSFLCGLKRKKKKKIKYNTKNNKDFDKCELMIYEEVAKMPPFQRKTLVLVGANGVGRRSLKERLIKSDPRTFASGLPHTSRPPREGEENGKSYYFVDRETIELGIKNDEYLEYGEFNGNLYGTKIESIQNVIRSGKMCVLDVNATSLKRLKNAEFMPYIIFIAAPSAEALRVMWEEGRRKGKGRGIAGPGTMELKTEDDFLRTVEESEQIEKVYKSYFDLTIVNDNFEDSFFQIRKALDELSTDTQWVPVAWVY